MFNNSAFHSQPFKLQPSSRSTSLAIQLFDFCRSTSSVQNFSQPFIRSTSSVQKFFAAVQPFDLIRSNIFHSRSSVRPHPFKHFPQPFSRSTSSVHKLSSAVQPFSVTVLNGFWTRFLSVRLPCVQPFERILQGTFLRERSHFTLSTLRNDFIKLPILVACHIYSWCFFILLDLSVKTKETKLAIKYD